MADALLVTGIHREELGFGDRVAALVDRQRLDVLRIPEGISHTRDGPDRLFYYNTRLREIYLQLRQQVKGRYRLLIDLHSGLNEEGHCADLYCADPRILHCAAQRSERTAMRQRLRLVKILAGSERHDPAEDGADIDVGARTEIPERIWNRRDPLYVGLESYLAEQGEGTAEDWRFARDLIEILLTCAALADSSRAPD
jgi:hypothetical protein